MVGIGTGQIDDKIRLSKVESGGEAVVEMGQVGFVAAAVGQLDVEIAAFLGEGKVARAVDGESENAVVVGQDAGRAVALMHVAIDDQDSPGAPLGLHGAGGHGGVVEDTESFAAVAEGMVRAAGQVGGYRAVGQRGAAGANCGASGPPRAFDHAGAPRKADGFLGLFGQLTATDLADVFGIVGAGQFVVAGGVRQMEIADGKVAAGEQRFAQPGVLFHREAMTGRQRKDEDIGVEKLHGRCLRGV